MLILYKCKKLSSQVEKCLINKSPKIRIKLKLIYYERAEISKKVFILK